MWFFSISRSELIEDVGTKLFEIKNLAIFKAFSKSKKRNKFENILHSIFGPEL